MSATNDTFVADILRDLREAGMTNGRIARYLGVSASAVSHWSSGARQPSGYATFRLARLHRHLMVGRAA